MSASLASGATAFFNNAIPSGLLPGPTSMARTICRLRYNTGNATDSTTGGFADCTSGASAAGSSNSDFFQGSVTVWLKHSVASKASKKHFHIDDSPYLNDF